MRAVICSEFGPPESLRVVEQPSVPLRPGQLRVAIEAAGLNFVDALIAGGRYQLKPQLPFTPGSELAGSVSEVGPEVEGFAVGDRVFASMGFGAFADEIVIGARQAVRVPEGVDAGRAATLGQSYCTAVFSLRNRAHLEAGQTLLVLGAGGGVGLAAVDVGRAMGATVIAAASSDAKLDLARSAGAVQTINYSTESLKDRARELTGGRGVDVAYDPVGGDLADLALRSLDNDGQLLVIGFASGTIPRLPANQILLRNRRVVGVDWGQWALTHPDDNAAMLEEVLAEVSDGNYHPTPPTSYPLEDVAVALRDLLERRIAGKAVLVP